MKLTTTQHDFNLNLGIVNRVIPNRPSYPVLANFLLVANVEKQTVTLTGFDLSLSIIVEFPAQIEQEGSLALPAKLVLGIVSRLPEDELTIDCERENLAGLLSSGGKYEIQGMWAEQFPELPRIEDALEFVLPLDLLAKGLQGTLFAASSEETKQVLTGIHITLLQNAIEFAATDGHRLSVVKMPIEEPEVEASEATAEKRMEATIPSKSLAELERMIASSKSDNVTVRISNSIADFNLGNQRLTTRILEEQYPNYLELIPRQFSKQMTIDRRLFVASLERIAVLANQKNGIVKLNLNSLKQELIVFVDAQDVGSGRETLSVQINGDELDIAFNVKYLLEGLKAFSTTEIQMNFNTAHSVTVITPLGETKHEYLLMPVQFR